MWLLIFLVATKNFRGNALFIITVDFENKKKETYLAHMKFI